MEAHRHISKVKSEGRLEPLVGGPVFDFGPGWGAKTNKWFKKYVLASNCALCRMTRYILLFGILVLLFGGPQLSRYFDGEKERADLSKAVIVETVRRGDSKTHVARRAVVDYLNGNGGLNLTPGQKVFIEANLVNLMSDIALQTGQKVEFNINDITGLIHQAQNLSPATLQKWEDYARGVKF